MSRRDSCDPMGRYEAQFGDVKPGIGHVKKTDPAEASAAIKPPSADQIRDEIDRLDAEILADQQDIEEKRLAKDALVRELIDMNQVWGRTQYPISSAETGE